MNSIPIQVVPDANGHIVITIKLIIANANTNADIPDVSTGNIPSLPDQTASSIQSSRSQNLLESEESTTEYDAVEEDVADDDDNDDDDDDDDDDDVPALEKDMEDDTDVTNNGNHVHTMDESMSKWRPRTRGFVQRDPPKPVHLGREIEASNNDVDGVLDSFKSRIRFDDDIEEDQGLSQQVSGSNLYY